MPIRVILAAALLGLAASACRSAAPPAPIASAPPPIAAAGSFPFRTANFHSRVEIAGHTPVEMRVWISGDGIREELRDGGAVAHSIKRRSDVYRWTEGEKRGIRGPASGWKLLDFPDTLDLMRELPFDLSKEHAGSPVREKLDGIDTWRYDFKREDRRNFESHAGTVWLLSDRAFPVRYVNRGYSGPYEIRNSDWKFDLPIPAAFFEPPSDVRFFEFQPDIGRRPPRR